MDQTTFEQMTTYIQEHADPFGEVVVINDFYDSYSIAYRDEKFILINFSPRENSVYSSREITPEEAFNYMQDLLSSK